tara:strand:+ start:1857 stop:1994 length:138 start_codon:yes stop_codon:yes gene_type:complete
MRKAMLHWSQIVGAIIVLVVLILVILFLTNVKELKEALLKLTSLG